jgi:hypothetical protein
MPRPFNPFQWGDATRMARGIEKRSTKKNGRYKPARLVVKATL